MSPNRKILMCIIILMAMVLMICFQIPLFLNDRYEWYVHFASKFHETGMHEKALQYATKAKKIDAHKTNAYEIEIKAYNELEMYEFMEKTLAELAAVEQSRVYYQYMGHLQWRRGLLNKSIWYFNRSLEIEPQHKANLINLGLVYLKAGKPELALVSFQKAKKGFGSELELRDYYTDAELGYLHSGLGFAYEKLGDYSAAIAEKKKAESHISGINERIASLIS